MGARPNLRKGAKWGKKKERKLKSGQGGMKKNREGNFHHLQGLQHALQLIPDAVKGVGIHPQSEAGKISILSPIACSKGAIASKLRGAWGGRGGKLRREGAPTWAAGAGLNYVFE